MAIVIRPGRPDEATLLSDLALRSKGLWGYSEQLLDSFRGELTLTPDAVVVRRTAVAELGGMVVGFVTVDGAAPVGELGMLFVVPEATGEGVGTELFRHAVETARSAGFHKLVIESDPNAETFYLARGAVKVGSVESESIAGRKLPLMEVDTAPPTGSTCRSLDTSDPQSAN
ncbi:GNAT family N-acetyltransferase [Nocardia lijiangensis]|uniref:GNAT family N-acetyltransferase n=1 Tax=Nocardia lijiangensis TaxID=299618 RepID=UPI00082DCE20|nr:GNAT family N-acetyltransferase [Nocardia lijiangensis]